MKHVFKKILSFANKKVVKTIALTLIVALVFFLIAATMRK